MVVIALEPVSLVSHSGWSGSLYLLQELIKPVHGFVNHIHSRARIHLGTWKEVYRRSSWSWKEGLCKKSCTFKLTDGVLALVDLNYLEGLTWIMWLDHYDFESYQIHWIKSSSKWRSVPVKPSHQKRVFIRIHHIMIWEFISLSLSPMYVCTFRWGRRKSWKEWDLCEPSMNRDPRSLPFWSCLASTTTCIERSARNLPSFCSHSFCSFPLSISFHHSYRRFLSRWAQMSRFPPPPFLTCTTRPSRASCSTLPANFSFLVLIGSPILLPLVLLLFPKRVDLLVLPTERKEGQTSLPLRQFLWHYWSAAVLVILPTLVVCIQLAPTLLFVLSLSE